MSRMDIDSAHLDNARDAEVKNVDQAINIYKTIIGSKDQSETGLKEQEAAIYRLGELYAKLGRSKDLRQLAIDVRPFFNYIPKAKTSKIVRTLITLMGQIPNTYQLQADLCKECIEWCIKEKRTFLKQRIETRLAGVYLELKQYRESIALIEQLVREVKKIDDKLLLVEINLIESRVHLALQNVPKSKGALTSARAAANSIYCPPALQAQIDLQAGTLCGEEKDYRTAFSYFYEAFEGYNTVNDPKNAVLCLKYMLLGKIMTNSIEEVYALINGKVGVKYAGIEIEAMRAVADAYKKRSLQLFEKSLQQYKVQLHDDSIIRSHLNELGENLLEQNLLRIIEPYSKVQIAHVAKLMNLEQKRVEQKLSEMILDKKFYGTLDQGSGDLVIFEATRADKTYDNGLFVVKELSNVVDRLYRKAKKLR